MEVKIPGGTAQLRDRLNVRGKRQLRSASVDVFAVLKTKYAGDIEAIKDAKSDEIKTDGELMDALDDFGGIALLSYLTDWSLETPIPATRDEWLDFEEPDVYDELVKVVTPLAYAALNNNAIVVTPETVNDPESPMVPSSV